MVGDAHHKTGLRAYPNNTVAHAFEPVPAQLEKLCHIASGAMHQVDVFPPASLEPPREGEAKHDNVRAAAIHGPMRGPAAA